MQPCPNCQTPLEPGTRFCGGCGRPVAAAAPPPAPAAFAPPPPPVYAPPPPPVYAPPPPAPAPAQPAGFACPPGQTKFDIETFEMWRMPKITLNQSTAIVESGALHYMLGYIQMQAEMPSLGGIAKSWVTKEKAVRPIYSGTGEIFLVPTFGEINLLELRGNEVWILDKGCFLASDATVELGVFTNKLMTSFFGGEGMFQTQVSGYGKVFYTSPGPLRRIDLRGETLTVDGSFAVARSASLEYKVEKANKRLFGTWLSGEGLVNTFSGHGTVLISPMTNRYLTLMYEFGGLLRAVRSVSRSG
jgi:uncharacterized protein (AIM24 family)